MSDILLRIDGKEVKASEGMTVLQAAMEAGISIPTLCHHEKLAPFAACRLCIVEAEKDNTKKLVVSCAEQVQAGWIFNTRSEKINKFRKTLIELMMSHAPHSPQIQEMAKEYGANPERFGNEASFCIHCGLCVRYCAEIKKKNAIGFVDRGIRKEISFIPEIAAKECNNCKECFQLCPTSYVQAVFVLTESMAFPRDYMQTEPIK